MIADIPARPARVPLSFAQRQLWFLAQLEGARVYNVPLVLRLEGELDRECLAGALGDVVGRHESLRTVFPAVEGEPFQRVLPAEEAVVTVDWRDAGRAQVGEMVGLAYGYEFSLAEEIPVRAEVLALGPREHVLILVVHHIACDGLSLPPLARDLAAAYGGRLAGKAPGWAELPVQYADFALWQHAMLGRQDDAGSVTARQAAFWRRMLLAVPEELALPADRPRPATASNHGEMVEFRVDAGVHAQLAAVARQAGASMFMVVQAALAALLTLLGAGTDIPLGAPAGGRADEVLNDLIGIFVNTLVLRVDTSGAPSFRELLARVRDTDLSAFQNQDLPFDLLVQVLNPPRPVGRYPLFQVMISFHNGADADFEMPGLRVSYLDLAQLDGFPVAAQHDLSFTVIEQLSGQGSQAGLQCNLVYATDLYDHETAELLTHRLTRILRSAAANPDAPISHIELPDAPEQHADSKRWDDPAVMMAPESTLISVFEGQASATPEAVALRCGGRQLTYRELNASADQLATELVARGVRAEDRVAVLLPPSLDSIVALLAIFKAGGVYLPVDIMAPPARVERVLIDAAPVLAITTSKSVVPGCPVEQLMLDAWRAGGHPPTSGADRHVAVSPTPSDAAYVIYTSGSAGAPQGVIVEHASLTELFAHQQALYTEHVSRTGLTRARVATVNPLSFDDSWDGLLALFAGHELHLLDEGTRIDPAALVEYIRSHGVDLLTATSGYMAELIRRGLLDGDPASEAPSVRTLIVGGDSVPVDLWELIRRTQGISGINHYGPTENTVNSLFARFDSAEMPVVGHPVGNVRAYLLNNELRPVPPGLVGELYVAGAQLARGYLGQPRLTAQHFLPCPFEDPGSRMYRTGDLMRRRRDGSLEFLGREDDQVKIRGFRVELAEVEAALRVCPGVVRAVAAAREDGAGNQRLFGYVVAEADVEPRATREFLKSVLPEYMVPSAIVVMDSMPLTHEGKIDRRQLPIPNLAPGTGRAPGTAHEQVLCSLFADVLDVAQVGIDDDFFQLGGHSLLAVQLLHRIRSVLGIEVRLRTLFAAPTVASLARRLRSVDEVSLVALRRAVRPARVPLSFAQRQLWFLAQLEGARVYNVPLVLRLEGELDRECLAGALGDVVGRHESLRTVFPAVEGEPFQRVLPAEEAVVTVDWRDAGRAQVGEMVGLAYGYEFSLAEEIPVRAEVLALGPREHVLILVVHHIACDGLSLPPLARDLAAAYGGRLAGKAPGWAELPVQYADFALWQHAMLGRQDDAGSVTARQAAFWRRMLLAVPEELALPADRPRPATASNHGEMVEFRVDAGVHAQLAAVARQAGASMFMVVQAALAALLTLLGAGTDIPLGAPAGGRADEVLNDLIGIFVNTLVLRVDTSGAPSFRELLARVRDTDLSAFQNQDLPFDLLVQVLNPPRPVGRYPLFQVMISFHNGADADFEMPGLRVSYLDLAQLDGFPVAAQHDLSFTVIEQLSGQGSQAGLQCNLVYATDLYDHETAELLTHRLTRILRSAAANPDAPISHIELPDR